MGLIEIVLAGLCLNTTCPGDERIISLKEQRVTQLKSDLSQDNLRITTFANGELSGFLRDKGSYVGTGVAFDLIAILQKKYNFNYTLAIPEDHAFLSPQDRGAKYMLESNKADVAAAFLPIINFFRDNITYSTSFDTAEWMVLMTRPKESATGSGLLAPFTTPVWILIILSVLVVGPIIYLLVLIQARLCRDENNPVYPLPSCVWFVYGALLKQGSTISPRTDSSRLLFSTWWLFIMILTAFYTANLTAFLTLSKFTLPITTPADIDKKHYHWVTNRANGILDHMQIEDADTTIFTRDKLETQIGRVRFNPDEDDMTILEQYVTKQNMMFIREKSVVNHVMYRDYKEKSKRGVDESDRCTFVVAKFPITSFPRAFAYSKAFKYQELFDSTFQHLVESGIIQYKLEENLPNTEICPLNLKSSERRLRNSDLLMTYLIVSGGLSVAGVIFLLEIITRFCKRKQQKPRRHLKIPKPKNPSEFNNNEITLTKKTPPPPYQTLFNPPFSYAKAGGQKKHINGRDYWIINNKNGTTELIPLRTPSAMLFQYTN